MTLSLGVWDFLRSEGWGEAEVVPLKADFSSRRYTRLKRPGHSPATAVLMQANADQKTPQFIMLAEILRQWDLSAPEIYAMGALQEGDRPLLVLMEDFGDMTFGRKLEEGAEAGALYGRATGALLHLHRQFDLAQLHGASLPVYDAELFTSQAELFLDAYFPQARKRAASAEERETFRAAWMQALAPLEGMPQTLMLRDYMLDNLMDLPDRPAWRSVGLLDFQDAGVGPVLYDLASLCETVRRDQGAAMFDQVIAHYHSHNPLMSLPEMRSGCRVLSAQRHARVLGIVARLAQDPARQDKLSYIPRLWNALHIALRDKALRPVKTWFDHVLPYEG